MKYIKKYEEFEDYDVEVGDILYCINNKGVEQELELGGKYTIDMVQNDRVPITFRLAETGSRWYNYRFTKDPNHPILVELNAKKYNV